MADLEKVIKGLECCYQENRGPQCDHCPYKDECEADAEHLMRDALSLLKAQEPVKPKEHEIVVGTYGAEFIESLCGNCGCMLVNNPKWRAKFCPECGKKVKWDG